LARRDPPPKDRIVQRPDLIIAGGGLSGCLAALALQRRQPDRSFLLLESGTSFGGNHTWSFFDSDLPAESRALIEPLIAHRWSDYEIRFPRRSRVLPTGYNSVTSDRLAAAVRAELPPARYRLGARIEELSPTQVTLAGGETLEADGIIDARGPASLAALDLGWQKFVGREYRFESPHGLTRPIIMDALVDQTDGYRFVYCLPFSPTEMLVEDTYYSLSSALDPALLGTRIDAYVAEKGWGQGTILREEKGVLPVAMGGRLADLWAGSPVALLGLRGGFFHPTTGYSLTDAAANALLLAAQSDFASPALHTLFRAEAERSWTARAFYRLLNRMLFRAAPPAERYRVLEHFYRLDAGLVERFYAGRSGLLDKARILSGRPPVKVGRALKALARDKESIQTS
jgi:lycopene beta-cyclase